jgi:hypothetical protein
MAVTCGNAVDAEPCKLPLVAAGGGSIPSRVSPLCHASPSSLGRGRGAARQDARSRQWTGQAG